MKPTIETEHRKRAARRLLLALVFFAFYLLHQDSWLWYTATPLVLGFLPIGLFYHLVYTLTASLLMILLVSWAWPVHLEEIGPIEQEASDDERPLRAGER